MLMLWLGLAGSAAAQILVPTHLSTALSKPTAKVGEEVELIINARIDDKWHLYSSDFSEDVGPVVFTMKFKPSPAYALVGKLQSIKAHHEHDDVFNGDVAFWEKTGELRQKIKVLQPGPLTISGEADYQTCTDVDGRCVPGNETLKFGPLTVAGAAAPAKATGAVPPAAASAPEKAVASVPAAAAPPAATAVSPATVAPDSPATAAAPAQTLAEPGEATAASSAAGASAAGATVAAAATNATTTTEGNMWLFAFGAFLAGLGALLTPCVFPLIPMTVSFFTSGSDSRQRGILKAVVYGLSIIFVYVVLGMIVSIILGPDALNFMATHWLPNLIFFAVFITFGLSFLGLFEITLPSGIVNKIDAQADKGGWGGVFFMALTLVLVSFSCTGPIVTSLLTMASQGQRLTPVIGMLGFSLAFALPFTLFAIFPAWLKSLPRSGGWLNTVKVVMGFVELGLALKFLSMADLAYHWHILPRDLYLVLWIVLAGLLGLYLLGKYRLSHDSALDHLSVGRLLMAVLSFSFMVYLVPGLFGAPLPLLAGYLPPQSKHDFSVATAENGNSAAVATTRPGGAAHETPRFGDFLELPHNLDGYFDLEQARRVARQQHKPLFVDFTGHACVNCRKMEATVWADPQVLEKLRNDYVVVALYVDDKTELPENEWYTSKRDQQVKKTLGKQNADLQLSNFQGNAQPLYALLDPDAPADRAHALMPPIAYEPDVAQFDAFLQAGLKQFQNRHNPVAVR
ncbi:protein-disulfide reductase DsbD family protein [Hymenobacter daeguensis]